MTAQILAAVIFVGMFALIIMDKFERQYVTLGSAALVLVVVFGICMHSWDAIKNALNLGAIFRADFWYGASESASSGVNWSTIFFITGMMIMVEGLGKSGFFRWLCLSLAKLAHYHVVHLFIAGKPDQKRQRLMKEKSLTADQAALEIRRVDRDRKAYHNYYCDTKWGDARGYDLVVNSGKLGIEKTVDTLVTYVRAYQAQNE